MFTVTLVIARHVNVRGVDSSLVFATELEQRDKAVAARLTILLELDRRVDELRRQGERLAAFRERLPSDRSHLDMALAEAERDLESARAARERASDAVERARGEDARTTARRHEAHAASDLHTSEERRDRLVGRRESLAHEADEAEKEARALTMAALELSAELASAPRVAQPQPPLPEIGGVLEWATRAHAALVVARSGLETERERVVREANELAASVLGEPLYSTSVAAVKQRLEERLA